MYSSPNWPILTPKVAIKIINCSPERVSTCSSLREVNFLKTIPLHANIVRVHEIFTDTSTSQCHIVMEAMQSNLFELISSRQGRPFPNHCLCSILRQLLLAIDHIHAHGYLHRDIKPENVLVSQVELYNYVLKLADFGLTKKIELHETLTGYVSTRWYRAPELALQLSNYSDKIDIWAFGTLSAELGNLRPLFPAKDELTLLSLQLSTLGHPGVHSLGGPWDQFYVLCPQLPQLLNPSYCTTEPPDLCRLIPSQTPLLSQLVCCCLQWDPSKRPTANCLLGHAYFSSALQLSSQQLAEWRPPFQQSDENAIPPHHNLLHSHK
uniref:ARAD1B20922p n=1 Tax=Blastobotrys adeninivorans TaxID=409370 RepID=A0A060TC68_BLAAD